MSMGIIRFHSRLKDFALHKEIFILLCIGMRKFWFGAQKVSVNGFGIFMDAMN